MASGIRVMVDESKRGLTIRWLEAGFERHVWVDQQTFERFLAAGETFYMEARPAGAHEFAEQAAA